MEKCIRNADGTRIHKREWRAIMAAAGAIIDRQLRPLSAPKEGLAPRTFYRKHCARVWLSAIAMLEVEQPILSLCAGIGRRNILLAKYWIISALATHGESSASVGVTNGLIPEHRGMFHLPWKCDR